MLRHTVSLPMRTVYDPEYGKWDIAPRVMGYPGGDYDGEFGYLLAVRPSHKHDHETQYLVTWDYVERYGSGNIPIWVEGTDIQIISGLCH